MLYYLTAVVGGLALGVGGSWLASSIRPSTSKLTRVGVLLVLLLVAGALAMLQFRHDNESTLVVPSIDPQRDVARCVTVTGGGSSSPRGYTLWVATSSTTRWAMEKAEWTTDSRWQVKLTLGPQSQPETATYNVSAFYLSDESTALYDEIKGWAIGGMQGYWTVDELPRTRKQSVASTLTRSGNPIAQPGC